MESPSRKTRLGRLWIYLLLIVVIFGVAAGIFVQTFQAANGGPTVATYRRGSLFVSIPYGALRAGTGRLTLEILDPEDRVLGRKETPLEIGEGAGTWKEEIRLEKALPIEDLVWHRVHYRFVYDDGKGEALEGAESISQILRTPVVHILGQQSYLSGSQAAVRVIVTDSSNEPVTGRGWVRIELADSGQTPRKLFVGRLNKRGTTEAQFQFPAGVVGNHQVRYAAETAIGSTEFIQTVRLQDKVAILLTTEKPIYQPGQMIHARALALDRANHEAVGNRQLVFEVEDSRGNKVFKKVMRTDEFGIAWAEFGLADEVNLGTYHLRALLGEAGAEGSNTAETALTVERYVLPKFKVAIDFAGKDAKPKHGYRPGDRVTGTVQANYFFGKPLEAAEVSVKATGMDVVMFEAGSAEGKTDREGTYRFDFKLPNFFAGRPLSHGAAQVVVEATVRDTAGHAETRGEPITVSESPLLITAVPEGGTFIPNLENQVFILTSYADGTPAKTGLRIRATGNAEQHATTDEGGVAVVRVTPDGGSGTLQIEAKDKEGNTGGNTITMQSRQGQEQILLRTERAVYCPGDMMNLRVFSTKKQGTAYVDIVKEGQTVLTRDLDIVGGQAELRLAATPTMAGTVDISAYLFGGDARPIADHRLVFVQPADELRIETTTDAPSYKPGGDARIRFRVTNSRGQGVRAALGLQVVDEAVFALAEKQPGFAKVFFYLEQEVMKPRYEIHAIGLPETVEPTEESKTEQRDRAARALFSATEMVNNNRFQTEFGRTIPLTKYWEYAGRYRTHFQTQMVTISESLRRACAEKTGEEDVTKVFDRLANAGGAEFRDPWNTRLRIDRVQWDPSKMQYLVRSAGPDKKFSTADDMYGYLFFRRRKVIAAANSGQSVINLKLEHDRGPSNDRANITGIVADQWGAAMEGAVVTARETSSGKVRTVRVNADGEFTFSALPKGEYQITVSSPAIGGTGTVIRTIRLEGRDLATLSVLLRQPFSDLDVEVSSGSEVLVTGAADAMTRAQFGVGGVPGGVVGGAMGGVMEGVVVNQMVALNAPAPPKAMPMMMRDVKERGKEVAAKEEPDMSDVHVRSYFPEALYINPEIITDQNGNASIAIPLADSITTWRMAMLASTEHGALGTATSSLKVFQDFFVDLDLPVTLTQGDQVSIPVAVYNYSGSAGSVNVKLKLEPDEWYALTEDSAEKTVSVDPGHVGGSQFAIEAKRIGKFKLKLTAQMGGEAKRADIVVREIEVIPNGREQNLVFNGQLETAVKHDVEFPPSSIAGASKIFVRLYPGPLSQVIEGMDSILRMPNGCFEQTSSSTYPNVLALDYLKRTKKLAPEVHAKAEGYIANGYQRLLTFEVPGGGFSWFGDAPANKILTAYGLMEFYDMSKVHEVDPKLILRTQQWLAGQQQADGSWKPDKSFINEGATNAYNSDVLRITAYIAWSLENTAYQGPAIAKASRFIQSRMDGKLDAYTLAVLGNFAVDNGKDREFIGHIMQLLLDARTEKDEQAWWNAEETSVYSRGTSASVETTGLAVQALLKWGQTPATVRKALNYITAKKDASGAWGNTQATIMALRALLLASEKGTADVRGTAEIVINGKTASTLQLTVDNNDLLHQFVFKEIEAKGANSVEIRFDGKGGGLGYQVAGQYFIPWDEKPAEEALSISVSYDRTQLAQNDTATATATVRNNLTKTAKMVMVDLGIPPGFELLSEDLQSYQEKSVGRKSGRLEKFNLTATQAILYFDSFAAGETVKLQYRLHAKYPMRARTFQSRVYEYYDPEVNSVARPVRLEVHK